VKVALIIEHLDPARGGAECSCLEMAQLLAREGLEVCIISGKAGPAAQSDDGFQIIDLGIKGYSRLKVLKTFIGRAQQLIDKRGFDIVHAITPIPGADIYQPRGGLIDETFRRTTAKHGPIGSTVRNIIGPNHKQRYLRRIERYLAHETACRFLAVSDYVRRQFREHLELPDARMTVIYNGVNIERFVRPVDPKTSSHLREILGIADDHLVGLFVANNLKLKGMDPLLASMRYLASTNAALVKRLKIIVVGTDDFWPYYKKAERWGLVDRIVFLGPARDVSRLYLPADFLVHPTWYDPCSRVVLEAIACQLPSITSNYNGAAEIVRQADCGLVVNDLSHPSELARAIETLADDDYRKRLAGNCIAARDQISMERHTRELIDLYKDMKK
jgi:UDP-glucose:(heptosyl)LPS alpha-1,3-glucosyltransferase